MGASEHDDEAIQPEWLKYEEAQRLCGLGRTKLWELGAKKHVKIARVGRTVRFSRRSLLDYMDRQVER
jgi:predicted DNA-binding transcriptional regulator AlpA